MSTGSEIGFKSQSFEADIEIDKEKGVCVGGAYK